jgi:hypothetical protein
MTRYQSYPMMFVAIWSACRMIRVHCCGESLNWSIGNASGFSQSMGTFNDVPLAVADMPFVAAERDG